MISPQRPVFVYAGVGTSDVWVNQTCKMLGKIIDESLIKRVTSLNALNISVELLVVPGGGYLDMFSSIRGTSDRVTEYVFSGGKYLGICAGAIMACDFLIGKSKLMDSEDPELQALHRQGFLYEFQVEQPDPWSFHTAVCVAPHIIKNPDSRESLENLTSADVFFEGTRPSESFKAIHYSGPAFFDIPAKSKVLLRYNHPIYLQKMRRIYNAATKFTTYVKQEKIIHEENPVAAFSGSYGSGRFVLTGIHPEMDSHSLDSWAEEEGFNPDLPIELARSERQQEEFIYKIFRELGLQTPPIE